MVFQGEDHGVEHRNLGNMLLAWLPRGAHFANPAGMREP